MATPTLEDLTKTELINLLREHLVSVSPKDIAWIIYRRRTAAAREKMKQAADDTQKYTGGNSLETHQKWLAAQDRWDKAVKEHDKAEAWYTMIKHEIEAGR